MDDIFKSLHKEQELQRGFVEDIIKSDDGFQKIELLYRGSDDFIKMLKHIQALGSPGHSFSIIVDPDASKEDGRKSFGFDGDGSDYIKTIKVNGKQI